jgi:hypothetical protein
LNLQQGLIDATFEIHLEDLLKLRKQTRIALVEEYRSQLFESARDAKGGWEALSRYLTRVLGRKISGASLGKWRMGRRHIKNKNTWIDAPAPLDVVVALSEMLGEGNEKFSTREIEKHVLFLKGQGKSYRVSRPTFPISLANSYTAAVIGHVLHDGHLEKQRLRVVYCNKDLENLLHYKRSIKGMLGAQKVEFGEINDKEGTTRLSCPNIVGYFLVLFGVRPGNKLETGVAPPCSLIKCEREVLAAYLRALSTDEASIRPASSGSGGCIKIELASRNPAEPPELIRADWEIFRKIRINPGPIHLTKIRLTKHGEISASWLFIITGRKNFEIFKEKVGFVSTRKRNKLDEILKRYRYPTDYVLLKGNFRTKLFQDAIKCSGGIQNYCTWLKHKLSRKVTLASVHDWANGRFPSPLDAIVATVELLKGRLGTKLSLKDVYSNIIQYKPDRNSEATLSQQGLAGLVEKLGFQIP